MDNELSDGDLLLSERSKQTSPILYIIAVLMLGLVMFYFFVSATVVDGPSMNDTLSDGQCVLLQQRGYTVRRGDIVVLKRPDDGTTSTDTEEAYLIKRVIALGGDKLLFSYSETEKRVILYLCKNGETSFSRCDEPYIKEDMTLTFNYDKVRVLLNQEPSVITSVDLTETYAEAATEALKIKLLDFAFTVPSGEFFFLGDNRNHSNDSRHFGSVKLSEIYGKMITEIDQNTVTDRLIRLLFRLNTNKAEQS